MKLTAKQRDAIKRARSWNTYALRDARNVAFYNAQAERFEGEARESLLRCAIAARHSMEANIQRVIDATRGIADSDERGEVRS